MIAQVLTSWGWDEHMGSIAQIALDYPIKQTDVTIQPAENITPSPNMFAVEIECDEITMNQIIADSRYPVGWMK